MRLLKVKTLYWVCLLLATCSLWAQTQSVSTAAIVTFECRWPAADPQWFELIIHPDGTAVYRSLPHQQPASAADDPAPDPFELSFTLSPASSRAILAVASGLPRFQPSLDKIKVAFTGTKTLRFQDGETNSSVSYNYSSSPELSAVTDLMQAISQSIELSQTLKFQLRFDKLSLDGTLRHAQELNSFHQLAELQVLEPVLQRIANDSTVMNIARQRAGGLLQSSSKQK